MSPFARLRLTTVLLLDADPVQAAATRACLEPHACHVLVCASLDALPLALARSQPDVLLVSLLSLPRAVAVLPSLRRRSPAAGLLCFPAAASDLTPALRAGADDCQTATLPCDELAARVAALVRCLRNREAAHPVPAPSVIRLDDLSLDAARVLVLVRGLPLHLTATEFRLLTFLATHTDRVVPATDLARYVWGRRVSLTSRTLHCLRVHASRLRRKLVLAGLVSPALTAVRSRGYWLCPAAPPPPGPDAV